MTNDLSVTRDWAKWRGITRSEEPVILAAPGSQLEGLLRSRVPGQILDAGEQVILRRDFPKVGPGIFKRIE